MTPVFAGSLATRTRAGAAMGAMSAAMSSDLSRVCWARRPDWQFANPFTPGGRLQKRG
jgi:hypothetical protein